MQKHIEIERQGGSTEEMEDDNRQVGTETELEVEMVPDKKTVR